MYEYDRHREIINILSETKSASVHSLAQKLYVSPIVWFLHIVDVLDSVLCFAETGKPKLL